MRRLTMGRVAGGRAALLAVHIWCIYGIQALYAAIDAYAELLEIDLPPSRWGWQFLLTLLVSAGALFACYLALKPLTLSMMLTLLPGSERESGVEIAPGVSGRLFGLLKGDPWWVGFLMSAPTVGFVCGAFAIALLLWLGATDDLISRVWIAVVALSTVAWVPVSRGFWKET